MEGQGGGKAQGVADPKKIVLDYILGDFFKNSSGHLVFVSHDVN
jgi:hypothetical protein